MHKGKKMQASPVEAVSKCRITKQLSLNFYDYEKENEQPVEAFL